MWIFKHNDKISLMSTAKGHCLSSALSSGCILLIWKCMTALFDTDMELLALHLTICTTSITNCCQSLYLGNKPIWSYGYSFREVHKVISITTWGPEPNTGQTATHSSQCDQTKMIWWAWWYGEHVGLSVQSIRYNKRPTFRFLNSVFDSSALSSKGLCLSVCFGSVCGSQLC